MRVWVGPDFGRAVVAANQIIGPTESQARRWLGAKTMYGESVTRNDEMIDPVGAPEPELTEDLALALLTWPDLQPQVLEKLSKNGTLMKSRKVKLALVQHPKTPRHVLLPLLRHLFTFDLMRVALMPTIAADIKVAAEESLINRLEKLSLGEKLSLARRASGRVAGALLNEPEPRVIDAALQNPRLTEIAIVKQLTRSKATPVLIGAICNHPKWKLRTEIIIALQDEKAAMDEGADPESLMRQE